MQLHTFRSCVHNMKPDTFISIKDTFCVKDYADKTNIGQIIELHQCINFMTHISGYLLHE